MSPSRFLILLALVSVCDKCAAANELRPAVSAVSDTRTVDASDPLNALRAQVDAADAAYADYERATEGMHKESLWKAWVRKNDSAIPEVCDGLQQFTNSPLAFGLLEWMVTNPRIFQFRPCRLKAIELLRDHHTKHPNPARICQALEFNGNPLHQPTVDFLRLASAENPERAARGYATFALARLTKQKAEGMAFWEIAPSSVFTNQAAQKARLSYLEESKTHHADAILRQAEELFEAVVSNYADVPNFPPGPGLRQPKPSLGGQARLELYACQHLTVGQSAPVMQGEDLDGQRLTLTDYRGKVVVVSFWASWCGPCMQMIPHEREMARRLAGRPFAVVGVNGDVEKADAIQAVKKAGVTWRSFWNGGGPEGGIAGGWNVHGWPTVYIIDAHGTIRFNDDHDGVGTDALLDAVVDKLLKEAEAEKRPDV